MSQQSGEGLGVAIFRVHTRRVSKMPEPIIIIPGFSEFGLFGL